MNDLINRQEYKYFINNEDIYYLRKNLSNFMTIDKNTPVSSNSYSVNTLYFDSILKNCLDEKLDGINFREKFRIRSYGVDHKNIKLESKQRMDTAVRKTSYRIDRREAKKLMNCEYDFLMDHNNNFLAEIYTNFKSKKFSPSVIVCYDREAYTLPYGNIRITFDKNLRTYNSNLDIFNTEKGSTPIFKKNMQILEVKFSMELPDHIKKILSNITASRSAISKFVYAQKYIDHSPWRDFITPPR